MHTVLLLILSLALVSCGAAPGADVGAALDGREFLSTSVTEAGAERPLVPGTEIRLSFSDGQLGASAGCNTIGGTYRIEDGHLWFEGGGMTEMGCDDARHAQDDWLVGALGSNPTVSLAGDELTLTADELIIRFRDSEVAEPDLSLVGPVWTVDSIVSGEVVSSVPAIAPATFEFLGDGRVVVDTGCNQGAGRFEADGGTLRFVDVVVTERACDGGPGEIEAAVLPLLTADSVTYAIDAAGLTLMAGDDGLGLRGG